jgi:hypothetical protein
VDTQERDYASSGLTIREAMLDVGGRQAWSQRERKPLSVLWAGRRIQTADRLSVPTTGRVRLEFLRRRTDVRQGCDLKMAGGCRLADGTLVPVLRTWFDPDLPDVEAYDYLARDGVLFTWNVYEVRRGSDVVAEKWTENAGFWVEPLAPLDRVYHCSPGMVWPPDFDGLVYRLTVSGS